MDIVDALDHLSRLVESARAMPMSASCVVNRAEVLQAIDEARRALPQELHEARRVLAERSAVVEQGRAEAATIVETALAERERLVAVSEVASESAREADRLLAAARSDAARMQAEVDDYVDGKLANFEVVLNKTLAAVQRGREKLSGRHVELEALADPSDLSEPLPG